MAPYGYLTPGLVLNAIANSREEEIKGGKFKCSRSGHHLWQVWMDGAAAASKANRDLAKFPEAVGP